MKKVIAYLRTSTKDQEYGIEAQRAAVLQQAGHRQWEVEFREEHASGRSMQGRPVLTEVLDDLAADVYDVLVVAKLDRLARSVADFAKVMEQATQEGWQIVVLDLGIDTTTPTGELVANIMAALAQWERRVIGQRTKEALAVAAANGVHVGRPAGVEGPVAVDILAAYQGGQKVSAIARDLTTRGVARPDGKVAAWQPYMVSRVLDRAGVRRPVQRTRRVALR